MATFSFLVHQLLLVCTAVVLFWHGVLTAIDWHNKKVDVCYQPMWQVVEAFVFCIACLLMVVEDRLRNGMGVFIDDVILPLNTQVQLKRLRILSVSCLLVYPFLWAWTIVGTVWFAREGKSCRHKVVNTVVWIISCYVFLTYAVFQLVPQWVICIRFRQNDLRSRNIHISPDVEQPSVLAGNVGQAAVN